MQILIVCRKQPFADSVACTLRREGHKAVPVCSATDARTHAEYLHFDLAIIVLPPLYCQRLGRQLQALRPDCRVLLMHTQEITGVEKEGFYSLPVSFRSKHLLKKIGDIE